jgi:NAD(P)-dependent dehydrogenase (short-subunit alcohol dehydrogenase family)
MRQLPSRLRQRCPQSALCERCNKRLLQLSSSIISRSESSPIRIQIFCHTRLSKAALQEATRLLAQALAPQCRVVGLAPGLTLVSGDQTEARLPSCPSSNSPRQSPPHQTILPRLSSISRVRMPSQEPHSLSTAASTLNPRNVMSCS